MRGLLFTLLFALLFYSGFPQVFDVDTIQYHGNADSLINVVILGDGYTQNQLNQFAVDATEGAEALFNEKPFSSYRNYFNVFLIKVPSNQSGAADDPGNLIDNYFGSTFNAFGIQRLLVPTLEFKVTNVLARNFPSYDQVLMIVNDNRYGGSGGWISTSSTHTDAFELILHELGHSFADLRDEYWAGPQYEREGINMTQESNPGNVKWKNWLGGHDIGIYPHSESPTWYRPHQNCKMRYLGAPYCAVCAEGIVEKIHYLSSPLVSYFPESNKLNQADFPVSFKLYTNKPEPNTLQIKWTLNNELFGLNTDSVKIEKNNLVSGTNFLNATITDTTEFLRISNHDKVHMQTVSWSVDNLASGIENLYARRLDVSIFPNPFHDFLTINVQETDDDLKVEIVDMKGSIQAATILTSRETSTLNLADLTSGYYIINFYAGRALVASHRIVKN